MNHSQNGSRLKPAQQTSCHRKGSGVGSGGSRSRRRGVQQDLGQRHGPDLLASCRTRWLPFLGDCFFLFLCVCVICLRCLLCFLLLGFSRAFVTTVFSPRELKQTDEGPCGFGGQTSGCFLIPDPFLFFSEAKPTLGGWGGTWDLGHRFVVQMGVPLLSEPPNLCFLLVSI